MKNFLTWFEDWELEQKVYKMILKGVIIVALLMGGFDYVFYSKTLAFLEVAFALISGVLLYCAVNYKKGYSVSSRIFILSMSLPIYWNLLFNASSIESTILFIFLPIITIILRPLKEVLFFTVLFGGSFLYISLSGIGAAVFTHAELLKLISMQGLIGFFVIIYVQTNREYQKVIATQSQELREANRTLEVLYKEKAIEASVDSLTGLKNRASLMTQFEYLYARYNRQKEVFSFIILDIDHFKKVNDSYGHLKGDEVLKDLSQIILECIREVDTAARYGGEEFVILLPQTNIVAAKAVAERIRMTIEDKIVIESKSVTASFGIIEIQDSLTIDEIIKKADDALYQAKESGRNKVVCA